MPLEMSAKKRKDHEELDLVVYSAADNIPVRTLYLESIKPDVSVLLVTISIIFAQFHDN